MKKHEQRKLFTQCLQTAFFIAQDSPRRAFYRVWIENTVGDIQIVKESGIKGKVLLARGYLS